jgi:hypothetical protein
MNFSVEQRVEVLKLQADVYRFVATEHAANHPRWDQ